MQRAYSQMRVCNCNHEVYGTRNAGIFTKNTSIFALIGRTVMNRTNTSPISRPESALPQPDLDDVLEELRQLRAALAIYRELVERLVERERAA